MVIDDKEDGMPNTDTIQFFDDESESATAKMIDVGVVQGSTNVGTPVTAMANRNSSAGVSEPFGVGGHMQNCCGEGETFAGNIAEIIIFARTLTPQERMDIENYLDAKYFAPQVVAGDYDGDGDVDDVDLFVWTSQFGVGTPPPPPNGDGDSDGDVDGNDFLIWQRNLGAGGASIAGGSIPEPTAFLLTMAALVPLLGRHRRRRRLHG